MGNKTLGKEEGIVQADMTLTLPEFLDTDLDIENTLQNQLCAQKIVQEHQATPSGTQLMQLQVTRTQKLSRQSNVVTGRSRKIWKHNLLIKRGTRIPGMLSGTKVTPW